ncbi:MAG: S-layer protein, partial [Candidatus Micrarchaeota archaeon]|nr:S-layer protein [Candidatus Micrarchaeota archaeon]
MKSLNVKRIAALAAGLAIGVVAAGSVSFSSIPIINSAGQPVVQIVVGSSSQPSDGVVAANIAAVIGNMAFTSTPITATVGGQSNVKCVVTTPSCTLTNAQVYLGESGTVTAAGSYTLKALIGSVINAADLNYGTIGNSKA